MPEPSATQPHVHDDAPTDPVRGVDPFLGKVIEGRYRVERKLGAGGMGRVYLGRHLRTGVELAIKVIDVPPHRAEEMQARCQKEAQAMMAVRSSHVAHALDFGSLRTGGFFLVMEYLRGEDLEQLVTREGPLPWARLGPMALQLCRGLGSAHEQGILHRDIKPSNCFRVALDGNPDHVKIIDFGIARDIDGATGPTQEGMFVGTAAYLAPEIIFGEPATVRSDLYSVGVTLYKLLTGVVPFRGESREEVFHKLVRDLAEAPSRVAPCFGIPPSVDAIILRTLAKKPEDRFADADALAQAIRACLSDISASSPSITSVPVEVEPQASSSADGDGEPAVARVLDISAEGADLPDETLSFGVVVRRVVALVITVIAFVLGTRLVAPVAGSASELVPLTPAPAPTPRAPVGKSELHGRASPTEPDADAEEPEHVPRKVEESGETPSPPGEAKMPAPKAAPGPGENWYLAARLKMADVLPRLRACLPLDPKVDAVKLRVDVAPSGSAKVKVIAADQRLRECVRESLAFSFGKSSSGGSFRYVFSQTSAALEPLGKVGR